MKKLGHPHFFAILSHEEIRVVVYEKKSLFQHHGVVLTQNQTERLVHEGVTERHGEFHDRSFIGVEGVQRIGIHLESSVGQFVEYAERYKVGPQVLRLLHVNHPFYDSTPPRSRTL